MRLFVALDIAPEIRDRVKEFGNQVRLYAPDVRWVGPETFHVTLQFLGETEKVAEIRSALQQVRQGPVSLVFRGSGFFPNPKSPRVFWVGIESDRSLEKLAHAVSSSLEPVGFRREAGHFTPHLTLARAGSGRPRAARGEQTAPGLRALAIKLESVASPEFGSMTANEFCLYESQLSPSGARYVKRDRYQLS